MLLIGSKQSIEWREPSEMREIDIFGLQIQVEVKRLAWRVLPSTFGFWREKSEEP